MERKVCRGQGIEKGPTGLDVLGCLPDELMNKTQFNILSELLYCKCFNNILFTYIILGITNTQYDKRTLN